jgi:hypothetical protein
MKSKDLAHKKDLTAEERQKLIEETVKIGERIMPKFGAKPNPHKK